MALGVLPLVVLAQLDTVLVPALALQLGDRFWWPTRPGSPAQAGAGAADRDAGERVRTG